MRVKKVGQFPAFDALGKARIVFYFGGAEYLSARGGVFNERNADAGADKIQGRGNARRPCADNYGIVQHQRAFSIMPTRWDLATAPVT